MHDFFVKATAFSKISTKHYNFYSSNLETEIKIPKFIMKKYFLLILFLYVLKTSMVSSLSDPISIHSIFNRDWNASNSDNSERARKNWPPIEMSQTLMNIAQKEANRLANLHKNVKPSFKSDLSYTGRSMQMSGYKGIDKVYMK